MMLRSCESSWDFASSMFSTTRGTRDWMPPMRRDGLARLAKRDVKAPVVPEVRKSVKVEVRVVKSRSEDGEMYSMSKATICCLRMRSCLRRKSWASTGVTRGRPDAAEGVWARRALEARIRERVVLWTIWWARSSKTMDYRRAY